MLLYRALQHHNNNGHHCPMCQVVTHLWPKQAYANVGIVLLDILYTLGYFIVPQKKKKEKKRNVREKLIVTHTSQLQIFALSKRNVKLCWWYDIYTDKVKITDYIFHCEVNISQDHCDSAVYPARKLFWHANQAFPSNGNNKTDMIRKYRLNEIQQ